MEELAFIIGKSMKEKSFIKLILEIFGPNFEKFCKILPPNKIIIHILQNFVKV
jgi:hypothetical protein